METARPVVVALGLEPEPHQYYQVGVGEVIHV